MQLRFSTAKIVVDGASPADDAQSIRIFLPIHKRKRKIFVYSRHCMETKTFFPQQPMQLGPLK
jgi:hypothetical protein